MKIGLANKKFINNNIGENRNTICKVLETNKGLDMIFFGEAFLNGFDGLTWDIDKDVKIVEEAISISLDKIKEVCIETSIGVGFGYFEVNLGNIYCSYIVIDKEGNVITNYRRQSSGWKIPNVSNKYKEGTDGVSFNVDNHYFDILLCGDGWDNDILNRYGKNNILLWPLYVNFDIYSDIQSYIGRIKEKYNTVLIIGSLSDNPVSEGGSFVIKNSELVTSTTKNEESVLLVDL
ncbi:hypothetical protein RJG79_02940 [Mycoplasmatota bacterium WC44]